jgi:hypothetical protein
VWFDLKSNGLPLLTIGVALAIVILLVSAVSSPSMPHSMRIRRACVLPDQRMLLRPELPPSLTPLSLFVMWFLGEMPSAFARRQGRTYIGAFEATQAHGTAQLAASNCS